MEKARETFPNSKITLSTLLQRKDFHPKTIDKINSSISRHCALLPNVHLAHHPDLDTDCLYDHVHLYKNLVHIFAKRLKDVALNRTNQTSRTSSNPTRHTSGNYIPANTSSRAPAGAPPRPSAPRPSAPRASAARPSAPRASAPRASAAGPSPPRGPHRASAPRASAARPSAPRASAARPSAPRASAPRASAAGPSPPRGPHRASAPRASAARPSAPRASAARPSAPRASAARASVPRPSAAGPSPPRGPHRASVPRADPYGQRLFYNSPTAPAAETRPQQSPAQPDRLSYAQAVSGGASRANAELHDIQHMLSIICSHLSRAHTVRFLIVFCDCCLSHCTNMIPMSNCRISVVLMSDCTTVKTRQKRTYSRKTCPEFYVINP